MSAVDSFRTEHHSTPLAEATANQQGAYNHGYAATSGDGNPYFDNHPEQLGVWWRRGYWAAERPSERPSDLDPEC